MNNFLVLFALLLTTTLSYSYDKFQLQTLPEYDSEINIDFGAFFQSTPYKIYGIYGITTNSNDEESTELLAEVALFSRAVGLISNVSGYDDDVIDIEGLKGKELKSICSTFRGIRSGLALIAGGEAFAVWNKNKVALKSRVTAFGYKVNLSYTWAKIKCVGVKNPNWSKKYF